MKKKLIALSFLSLFGLATFTANAQTAEPKALQEQGCCKKDKKDKKDCADKKVKCVDKKKCLKNNPFEGINLTEDQKQKIEQLKADRKQQKEQDKKAAADKKQKDRDQFNAKLATILTADQMAQYNANCEKMKAHKKDRKGPKGEKKNGHKKFTKGVKAE